MLDAILTVGLILTAGNTCLLGLGVIVAARRH